MAELISLRRLRNRRNADRIQWYLKDRRNPFEMSELEFISRFRLIETFSEGNCQWIFCANAGKMFSCAPCNKIFNGTQPYNEHIVSEKHRKKVSQPSIASSKTENNYLSHAASELSLSPYVQNRGNSYICTLCAAYLNSSQQLQSHLSGSKHNKMVNTLGGMPANNTSNEDKDELSTTFKFHDLVIKDVIADVKIFKADEPIVF